MKLKMKESKSNRVSYKEMKRHNPLMDYEEKEEEEEEEDSDVAE